MMTAILAWLGRRGVPEEFRKVILLMAVCALLILILSVGKCAYDRSVIERHTAGQEAANARADRAADATAAEQRRKDDQRLAQERQELEKVTTNADDHVERRLAFHRCLRLQQEARAAGREPPSCN